MHFILIWLFDKLGYIPKIKVDVGAVAAWPFPEEVEKPKPRVRKTRALPSKATVAKTAARTARAKKAK
jgi:hypothetical protein